jgi:hypothetical protein
MREREAKDAMRLLKRIFRGSVPLLAVFAAVSCVDSDDRCGDDRVLDAATDVCVCKPGTIDQGSACVEMPPAGGGLGAACEDSSACADPAFPDCHTLDDGSGYCTKNDCTSNDDCGQDFRCALEETPAYCHAPPTGQGVACESDDDCADFDATFCSVGSPFGVVCLVPDCVDDTSCSPGYTCFDIGMFMPGMPKVCLPPM